LAQTERAALCDTALEVGEDRPTLCDGWNVKDLVVHLLVREGSPGAVGIAVPFLSRLTDAEMRRVGRHDFDSLVQRLRGGPPRLSIYAVPRLEVLFNTLEYFVHHEDIRRAQVDWAPRRLPDQDEKVIWSMVRTAAKGLTRSAPVGVTLENSVTGSRVEVRSGDDMVTVRGLPSELTLFVFGRKLEADVELLGEEAHVARLSGTSLGI
jgi:uncharacterized protein (TIGR03085 family)